MIDFELCQRTSSNLSLSKMFLRESRFYCIDEENNFEHRHFFFNDLVIMLRFSRLYFFGFQMLLVNDIDLQLAITFLAFDKPWDSNHQFLGYSRFECKDGTTIVHFDSSIWTLMHITWTGTKSIIETSRLYQYLVFHQKRNRSTRSTRYLFEEWFLQRSNSKTIHRFDCIVNHIVWFC